MAMRAIETRYNGFRFRSRLEARWAVFLDEVGLKWDYEPEGVLVDMGHRDLPWLPDFLLETGQLVEVKGNLNASELARLIILVTEVAKCGKGRDVIMLGSIPQYRSRNWPVQLHSHGGLWALPWELHSGCPLHQHRPRVSVAKLSGDQVKNMFLKGIASGEPSWAVGAADKARGARFEHGEKG